MTNNLKCVFVLYINISRYMYATMSAHLAGPRDRSGRVVKFYYIHGPSHARGLMIDRTISCNAAPRSVKQLV